jgi:HD-GYP domain-containing protein (c-di-GMP phosphodiesterase class II)
MIESETVIPDGENVSIFFSLAGIETQVGGTVVQREGIAAKAGDFEYARLYFIKFHQPQREIVAKLHKIQSPKRSFSNKPPLSRQKIGVQMKKWMRSLSDLNKEIWLVLSLVAISIFLNFLLSSNQMVLGFYSFPTVLSAYFYGRRHAVLTALASIFMVMLVAYFRPLSSVQYAFLEVPMERWLEFVVWGGILVLTAYAMGTLYEHKEEHLRELRETYQGVLLILQQFIAKDKYTQNHSYRVSIYAMNIAKEMSLDQKCIEDVRDAALIHDIGKLDIGKEILYKAARLDDEEFEQMRSHIDIGISMVEPVRGSLKRILPLIISHHDKYDGSGYHGIKGEDIPLGARIISLADAYDSMVSDRPYRKGMAPLEAKDAILAGNNTDYDPDVVDAFLALFKRGEMDMPDVVVLASIAPSIQPSPSPPCRPEFLRQPDSGADLERPFNMTMLILNQ